MKKLLTVTAALVAAVFLAGPVVAGKAENGVAGVSTIVIDDKAGAFTAEGIQKAEDAFHATQFKSPTNVTVVAYKTVPESKRSDYEAAKGDKAKKADFFGAWTRELATKRASRGVFVLVSMEGGHIHAIDDRQSDAKRGFGDAELKTLEGKIADGFKKATPIADPTDAKKARDEGLLSAVNYVAAEMKNTVAPEAPHAAAKKENGGNWLAHNWWVILVAVLGVWLLIGLMRALAGGGGGGGGGYGGGGGGGGFMSGLMGGLFGAMAGMYLYNNVFGGGMSSASAGDSYGGDGGNSDTGAGDYSGGGDGGGTDFDGGGGDAGGGGDWGGGGGDFGGGGGDFGGGGGDW